jgi:hypothetical protein
LIKLKRRLILFTNIDFKVSIFSTQSGHFVEASFDFAPQEGTYPLVRLVNEETGKLEVYHLV